MFYRAPLEKEPAPGAEAFSGAESIHRIVPLPGGVAPEATPNDVNDHDGHVDDDDDTTTATTPS